jgi:hypothetical protein
MVSENEPQKQRLIIILQYIMFPFSPLFGANTWCYFIFLAPPGSGLKKLRPLAANFVDGYIWLVGCKYWNQIGIDG